ncbi:UNVERIFIED_CONTAM: hypothetical protein K2H54_015603, partial [Gekko kuhli]
AKQYWKMVKKMVSDIVSKELLYKPECFLLSMLPKTLNKYETYLIMHILVIPRIEFARVWKEVKIPMEEVLQSRIIEAAKLEKISFILQGKSDEKYEKYWGKVKIWLNRRN